MIAFGQPPSNISNRLSFNIPNSYTLCVAILTIISLWPVWTLQFLPMQDYPQHLVLSHILATYDDPSLNWKAFYHVELGLKPYMFWYLAIKPLATLLSTETAGRILISIYILMLTVLAFRLRRFSPINSHPWGALLLFPFAFNQIYFLGFANYLISLPLLFFALLQLHSLTDVNCTSSKIYAHILCLFIIFLIHPYTLLVYIVFAFLLSLRHLDDIATTSKSLTPCIVMSLVFIAWYSTQHVQSSVPGAPIWQIYWLPFSNSIIFYLTIFTGMRWFTGVDWFVACLWGFIATTFLVSWLRNCKNIAVPHWSRIIYLTTLVGFFILPFWLGYYSYFNLRLAPVSYFAASIILAHIRLDMRTGIVIFVCSAALLFLSIRTQTNISKEVTEIMPILSKMEKNRLILPLIFNGSSSIIDPCISNQSHNHDADYYHIIVGGGANPTLFPNAMMPVQYRPGVVLPSPVNPNDFTWRLHGGMYDYFIIRNAPNSFFEKMSTNSDFILKSGPWVLYRNKNFKSNNPRTYSN